MAKLRLERALVEKGVSKRRFAKLIGIDYSNVFRYFRPGYDPRLSTLEKWAIALGVQVRDLYEEVKPQRGKH